MSRRWRTVSFPLLLACCGCHSHGGSATPDEASSESEASVTVRVEPARFDTVARVVEGLGRCEALPDHIATLTPAVEGHVHELLVAQGDAGQEGAADRRARQGGRAGRSRGEDRDPRRAQGLAGPAQVAPPPRGAEGHRAGDRAGQGGGGPGQGGRRSAPSPASLATRSPSSSSSSRRRRSSRPRSSSRRPRPSSR